MGNTARKPLVGAVLHDKPILRATGSFQEISRSLYLVSPWLGVELKKGLRMMFPGDLIDARRAYLKADSARSQRFEELRSELDLELMQVVPQLPIFKEKTSHEISSAIENMSHAAFESCDGAVLSRELECAKERYQERVSHFLTSETELVLRFRKEHADYIRAQCQHVVTQITKGVGVDNKSLMVTSQEEYLEKLLDLHILGE